MCVYLGTTFQVSSIILASFNAPTPQNESLKSPPRFGVSKKETGPDKIPLKIVILSANMIDSHSIYYLL